MEPQHRAAVELLPANFAHFYRLVPLGFDGEVLRVATITESMAALDDLRLFLGVARVEVEVWPLERAVEALVEA